MLSSNLSDSNNILDFFMLLYCRLVEILSKQMDSRMWSANRLAQTVNGEEDDEDAVEVCLISILNTKTCTVIHLLIGGR